MARADSLIFMSCAVVLRTVTAPLKLSPSRTSGGKPEISCTSWVERMLTLPVPK